jgi:hypothetical protein
LGRSDPPPEEPYQMFKRLITSEANRELEQRRHPSIKREEKEEVSKKTSILVFSTLA